MPNSRSLRRFAMICALPAMLATPTMGNPVAVLEAKCPEGQAANDYDDWEFIHSNAIRTAEYYAIDNNPKATFILAEVEVIFQMGGEYAGEYLVKLLFTGSMGTALAMLRPNFDFCGDPSTLDDGREDLFTVVVAKLDGRDF